MLLLFLLSTTIDPTHNPRESSILAFAMENVDISKNVLMNVFPVAAEVGGQGFPFAPENWPQDGDVWGWRTGRRVTSHGYFQDRYLYLPNRLSLAEKENPNPGTGSSRRKHIFASKLAVERYVKATFPDADLNAFFSSFSWRIPALPYDSINDNEQPIAAVPLQQVAQAEEADSECETDVMCKARNKNCDSLVLEKVEKYSPAMPCDVCCVEGRVVGRFCRDCSCIYCCRTVSSANGGYTYFKCPGNVDGEICGHVCHIDCALRCYVAGTVGGTIELDVEYLCRRCDRRTDMFPLVNNLLQTCKTTDFDDEIREDMMRLAKCLLRGSEKPTAKELLRDISKIRDAINLENVLKADGSPTTHSAGLSNQGNVTVEGAPPSYDHLPPSLKLEVEVDQVLQSLRKAQQFEYSVAEETLQAHKKYLQNLHEQLESEKSELAFQNSSGSSSALRARKSQIRREEIKFEDMKKVANGFGRTSKNILKEHFGFETVD